MDRFGFLTDYLRSDGMQESNGEFNGSHISQDDEDCCEMFYSQQSKSDHGVEKDDGYDLDHLFEETIPVESASEANSCHALDVYCPIVEDISDAEEEFDPW